MDINIENEIALSKARTERILGMIEEQKNKHDPHDVSTLKTELAGLNKVLVRFGRISEEVFEVIKTFSSEYNAVESYIHHEDERWKALKEKQKVEVENLTH